MPIVVMKNSVLRLKVHASSILSVMVPFGV